MSAGGNRWAVIALVAAWWLALISVPAHAADTVAILYPKLPEPESELFELIRGGARDAIDSAGARSVGLAVGESESKEDLANRVQAAGATRLLLLGRRAYELSAGLERRYPSYVAAVDLPVGKSSRVSGISMYADPTEVFKTLHLLAPRIERVIIVVDRDSSRWMLDAAKTAASEERLEAIIHDARSTADSANRAWNVLQYGNPDTDALWVLDSSGYATEDVLPELVAESWRRRFLVFSNVVRHVREGALFAVYVDPKGLGRRAGAQVLQTKQGAHEIVFLRDLQSAVNTRVAAHLELPVSVAMTNSFNLVVGRP